MHEKSRLNQSQWRLAVTHDFSKTNLQQFTATTSQCFNHGLPYALRRLISTAADFLSLRPLSLCSLTLMYSRRILRHFKELELFCQHCLGLKASRTIFKQEIQLPELTTVSNVIKRVKNCQITARAYSYGNLSERSRQRSECYLSMQLRQMRNLGKWLSKENVWHNYKYGLIGPIWPNRN